MLGHDTVFFSGEGYNFLDVQGFDKVSCQHVWCSDDHLIDVLASQYFKHPFLKSLDGIVLTSVVAGHLVIPKSNVQEVSLFLGSL